MQRTKSAHPKANLGCSTETALTTYNVTPIHCRLERYTCTAARNLFQSVYKSGMGSCLIMIGPDLERWFGDPVEDEL
jgi:hypothetical protein